jgi:uncharacterized membrane protein YfcA
VGGGGIYVPLGIIILRFASKPATGLSQASIFGASVGGLILNIRNNHPDEKIRDTVGTRDEDGKLIPYDKDMTSAQAKADEQAYLDSGRKFYTRPLIDYDMALFLAPMEMAGAVLGVIIQKVLPNWLFLSLAGIVLGITSYKTYQKFFAAYKKDKEMREKKTSAEMEVEEKDPEENEATPMSPSSNGEKANEDTGNENNANRADNDIDMEKGGDETQNIDEPISKFIDEKSKEAEKEEESEALVTIEQEDEEKLKRRRMLLEEDSRQYPVEKLAYLLILWIGLAIIIFMKGGKGVDSIVGITCKSPWYGILIAIQFLWTLGFAARFGIKLVKRHEEKVRCDYPFHTNDVLWDAQKLRYYSFFTFVAGIIAGLIGVGGGMVLGPLMLILGIHPRVSSATTATMIVLTSSSVAVMFVTSGLVPWEYAVLFFSVCLCGAYIGKKYIDAYVKRTGMSSILIGILATIIAFATIGCFVIVLLNLNRARWCFDSFKPFCVDYGGKVTCPVQDLIAGLESTVADIETLLSSLKNY